MVNKKQAENELFLYTHNHKPHLGNPLKNLPATYLIIHSDTKKAYIGSTNDLSRRSGENLRDLKNNCHKNKPLQEAYNKNNGVCICFHPCESVEKAQQLEQYLVTELNKDDLIFNVAVLDTKITAKGRKLSETHKEILKQSNRVREISDLTKQRMSEAQKNFNKTEEGQRLLLERIKSKSKPVTINEVEYPSVSEASRQLNIPWSTLSKRLKKNTI